MEAVHMDSIQLVIFLATIVGTFLWSRSESREDNRRIENLVASIQQEMKDFHGRLCALEEKNRNK
jgi:nicotinamide riboside transporter PnuC